MVQAAAIDVINYVESYWDETLTRALVSRITAWDDSELDRFYSGWPAQASEPSGLWADLPELRRGQVRPIVGAATSPSTELELAPLLLLYVESVLVDAGPLLPTWTLSSTRRHPVKDRWEILHNLGWLAAMRPLVIDGSVLFTNKVVGLHPSAFVPLMRTIDATKKADWKGTEFEGVSKSARRDQAYMLASAFAANVESARRRHGTLLALEAVEERLYRLSFGNRESVSARASRLAQLGRWSVPAFRGDASDLVAIRNSDRFAEWRSALSRGLDEISKLSDEVDGDTESRGILAEELAASFRGLEHETARSPVLRSLNVGWKGLAVGGVLGAAEGTLTGNAMGGLVTGAAALAGGVIDGYLQAAQKRADAKAVWDVVMSFRDWGGFTPPAMRARSRPE
ncbi:hypothetical protein [Microbacterium allomyrinae]|uniref:Uncharacterized protein n=1 Tax=Microbacterium allomyrinae TaxID=2830666 RepID=A0A9X1LS06_9MICO|nr:hypothetical protein [Microbacterium allomyrinae]MCC2030894.1 hypothetical protein [Microbacterium allomyrinae]